MARSREQVIDLLGKLRQITFDNGATLEESKTAAAHVERLLAEHNLSMFDVESQEFKEDVIEEALLTENTQQSQWIVTLSSKIGFALGCKVYIGKRHNHDKERWCVNLTFVGHEADASVARFLYDTLSKQLYAMGSVKGKEAGRTGRMLVTYRAIFIENAAREIAARLRERQEHQEVLAEVADVPSASTQMVHVKTAAVDQYVESNPRWSKAKNLSNRGYQSYDSRAALDGREAGREIPLNRELAGQQPPKGELN